MLLFYRKLCNVILGHSYYTDGLTPDFALTPTKECAKILKGLGIIFRQTEHGGTLVYRANDESGDIVPTNPVSDLADDTLLQFDLHLKNEHFFHFTEFGFSSAGAMANRVFWLNTDDNSLDSQIGSPLYTPGLDINVGEFLERKRSRFHFAATLTGNPSQGELRIKDFKGNIVKILFTPKDEDDNYIFDVDLSGQNPGKYTIEKYALGVLDGSRDYYVDEELAMSPVFGRLEIVKSSLLEEVQDHNADDPDNRASLDVRFGFNHREEPWKYRVVFKVLEYTGILTDYTITDLLMKVGDVDDRYNTKNLVDQFHFVNSSVHESFLGYDSIVFSSTDAMGGSMAYPFYQEVKHDLQLDETATFGTIIKKLPNPDTVSGSFEIIVYV